MRKLFLTFGLALLPLFSYGACYSWLDDCCPPAIKELNIDIGTGYRQDNFNWNIGGIDNDPDVLSELTWKRLGIWTVDGQIDLITCNDVYLRANGTWGKIYRGKVRDSDYLFDDREFEFSRSISDAGKGTVYDLSGAIGYRYCYVDGGLFIIPLAGYAYDSQHLHLFNGEQVINIEFDPLTGLPFFGPLGDIPGLNSTYKARWWGPWIGLNLQWNVNYCFSIYGEYQYHWARYKAKGDWNLRPDLPHGFSHKAHGKGQLLIAGGNYKFCGNWTLGLEAEYQYWRTYKGQDRTDVLIEVVNEFDIVIGEVLIPVFQPLHRVNWRSMAYTVNLGYEY